MQDLAALVAQLLLLVGLAGPSSTIDPASGRTLKAIGFTYALGAGRSTARPSKASAAAESATLRTCSSSSVTPLPPVPETAWYDETYRRTSPAWRCSGASTGIAAMVVQFGLATMPLGSDVEVLGVDLAHHERDVGVHPPGAGVVDHHGPGRGDARRQLERGTLAVAEQRDVEPGQVGRRRVLDRHLTVAPRQRRARRPGGREEPHVVQRKSTLRQQGPHDPTDLTSSPEHTYAHPPRIGDAHSATPQRLILR